MTRRTSINDEPWRTLSDTCSREHGDLNQLSPWSRAQHQIQPSRCASSMSCGGMARPSRKSAAARRHTKASSPSALTPAVSRHLAGIVMGPRVPQYTHRRPTTTTRRPEQGWSLDRVHDQHRPDSGIDVGEPPRESGLGDRLGGRPQGGSHIGSGLRFDFGGRDSGLGDQVGSRFEGLGSRSLGRNWSED